MSKRTNWNSQIVTIEQKGFAAYTAGINWDANPYGSGYLNQNGKGGGLQRQRKDAWYRGWKLAERQAKESGS